jgi:hypothetical protein
MALTKIHNRMIDGAYINVMDFGAIGDGSANDTAAFSAAIDKAVSEDKTLYVPSGSYNLSNWTQKQIDNPLTIIGEGKDLTIITGASTNFIRFSQSLRIENLTFKTFDKFLYGRVSASATLPVEEVSIKNVVFDGGAFAIILEGDAGDNAQSGARLVEVRGCRFTNLTFAGFYAYWKRMDNVVVDGNIYSNISGPSSVFANFIGFDVVSGTRQRVSVTNNYITNVSTTSTSPVEVQGCMIHEADEAIVSGNVISFLTTAATTKEDVEGIYIRDVGRAIVTNNILRAVEAGDGVIDIKEDCGTALVSENLIDNSGGYAYEGGSGIQCYIGECFIKNNRIKNVGGFGINVVDAAPTEETVIEGNWIEGVDALAGIFALCGSFSRITNNTIYDVKRDYATNVAFGSLAVYGDDAAGIYVIPGSGTSDVFIANNAMRVNVTASNSPAYGIHIGATTTITDLNVSDNIIESATQEYSFTATTSLTPTSLGSALMLVDGVSAPAVQTGFAKIYIDTADGDLKIKFGDGTVKTIVVDT